MTLHPLLDRATTLHRTGRIAEAELAYLEILRSDPAEFTSCHMLGLIRAGQGRSAEALELIDAALKTRPNSVEALTNCGFVLQSMGHFDEALASYGKALALRPDFAVALNNRGIVLWHLKRFEEALASYDAALNGNPDYAEAHYNRGIVLNNLKRFEESLGCYDRALALKPDYAQVWYSRGNMHRDHGRFEEALGCYGRAVAIKPDYVEAWNNAGNILRNLGRSEEALNCYEKTLAIKPDYAEAWNHRGNALLDLKRFDEALSCYDRAIAIKPDLAPALTSRGALQWTEYRRYELAVGDLEKAVLANPDHEYARGFLLHLRMHGANWRDFERETALIDSGVRAGKRMISPFAYLAISESPADLQACARIYAGHRYPAAPVLWTGQDRRRDKIRVGYVSGEFREQVVAYLTAGLYEQHDKERFEIVAFDNGWNDESPTRERLESAFDEFIDISKLSDSAAAEKIAAKEIDILVNLNGYFGLQRMGVFAHRPAPVQVNYLGFPGTLGARYVDYVLADHFVIPEDERRYYDEQVVYLPDTYQVNDSKREMAQTVPSRAENGLPENAIVFCNFNQGYKLTPVIFALWMRILNEVEGSVLWMPENTPQFRENLRREVARSGVSEDRLIFAPHVPLGQHLARLTLADLFLDSLPYNAHTTASDALWAGLPLLTCRGKSFAGRVAASQLHAIGLPELVTENLEAYEALALALAGDPALLRSMREKLSHNRLTTPLFDTDRFRRHLESAYTTMWERHTRGESPQGFHVAQLP